MKAPIILALVLAALAAGAGCGDSTTRSASTTTSGPTVARLTEAVLASGSGRRTAEAVARAWHAARVDPAREAAALDELKRSWGAFQWLDAPSMFVDFRILSTGYAPEAIERLGAQVVAFAQRKEDAGRLRRGGTRHIRERLARITASR